MSLSDTERITVKSKDEEFKDTGSTTAKVISLYSYTLTVQELKQFVSDIAKLEKRQTNVLTAYRPIMSTSKKAETLHWDSIKFISNKTVDNTIVSNTVKTNLFDDMEWFMNNEQWYFEKGVDYKRGYLLYGEPGCGKSSSIKAIANKYRLPIFNLDLETVKTNSQLISLTNDILCEVPDKPYILAMEDFDRYEMFTCGWRYQERKDRVTMQCLLNVIDGIVESHGRILIMTCNDKEKIISNQALVRPGRIDKIVEFTFADNSQASTLINNYYGTSINIEPDDMETGITPAELIKRMQSNNSLDKILFYVCKNNEKIKSMITPEQAEKFSIDMSVIEKNSEEFEKPVKKSEPKKKRPPKKLTIVDRKKLSIDNKLKEIQRLQKKIQDCDKTIKKMNVDIEYQQKDYEKSKEQQQLKEQKLKEKQAARAEKQKHINKKVLSVAKTISKKINNKKSVKKVPTPIQPTTNRQRVLRGNPRK